MLTKSIVLCISLITLNAFAEILPKVVLEGKNGGKLDGTAFDTSAIKNKVYVMFYVDPDEKDLNEETADLIKAENFDKQKYGSLGVINMAATWLPNIAIESSLKTKQKKFPDTIYVKDLKKIFVKEWGLKDDSSDILVFNKAGEVIYKVMGKATPADSAKIVSLIKENI